MTLNITDEQITSETTTHTARFSPYAAADGQGAWAVTWLRGRLLTFNQAITAMTIAETVGAAGGHISWSEPESIRWWALINAMAQELHITGSFAAAEAADPEEPAIAGPDSSPPGTAARTGAGERCPSWCVTDHEVILADAEVPYGYTQVHRSSALPEADGDYTDYTAARAFVVQRPQSPPVVALGALAGQLTMEFSAEHARMLAAILRAGGLRPPIADGLAAAADLVAGLVLRAAR